MVVVKKKKKYIDSFLIDITDKSMKGLIHLVGVIGIVSTIAIITQSPIKVGIGFIVGLGYLLIMNNTKDRVIKRGEEWDTKD